MYLEFWFRGNSVYILILALVVEYHASDKIVRKVPLVTPSAQHLQGSLSHKYNELQYFAHYTPRKTTRLKAAEHHAEHSVMNKSTTASPPSLRPEARCDSHRSSRRQALGSSS